MCKVYIMICTRGSRRGYLEKRGIVGYENCKQEEEQWSQVCCLPPFILCNNMNDGKQRTLNEGHLAELVN